MAEKNYLSKVQIGGQLYYIKDTDAQTLLATLLKNNEAAALGTAAFKDTAEGVGAGETGLVTGAQVAEAIKELNGAMHFVDATEAGYTPTRGDVKIEGTKEYVYNGSKWIELGDEGLWVTKNLTIAGIDLQDNITVAELQEALGLGDMAYADEATGTVEGQTISGIKATGTTTGTVTVELTQTSTAAALTKGDFTPAGSVEGTVVPTGTVAIAKDNNNGTQISGTVSAPDITIVPATTTIKKVTSVGSQASKAADTFTANGDDTFTQGSQASWSAKVEDETLSFDFTANTLPTFTQGAKATFTEGAFTPNELPTLENEGTSVMTGITSATATAPEFTGDKFGATFTGNASGDAISATFSGTEAKNVLVTGVNYDKATVDTEKTTFNSANIELTVGDITVAAKEVTVTPVAKA